jgi:hypothetical protein
MRVLAIVFGALVASCLAKDAQFVNDEITVQFLGHSGKFKLWRTQSGGDTNIEVSFDKLEEVDMSGKKQASINLATTDFAWENLGAVRYQGYDATEVMLTTTLSNGANLTVDSYIFQVDAKVIHGNTTYTVAKNHVKFTVIIHDWPFASTSNTLQFGCECKFKGGSKGFPDKLDPKNANEQKLVFGPGQIDIANKALVDGDEMKISPTIVSKGAFTGVTFEFPYFSSKLEYDPTLSVPNAAWAQSGIASMASAACVLVLALARVLTS